MKKMKMLGAGLLALSFCVGTSTAVYADEDTKKSSASLLAEYGVSQEAVDASEARLNSSRDSLAQATSNVEAQESRINEIVLQVKIAERELADIEKSVASSEKKIGESEKNVGQLASTMYKTGGMTALNETIGYVLDDPDEVSQKAHVNYMTNKVAGGVGDSINVQRQLQSVLENDIDRQDAKKKQIEDMKRSEEEMLSILEEQKVQAEAERQRYSEELKNARKVSEEINKNYLDAVAREKREAEELKKRQEEARKLEAKRLAQEAKLKAQAEKAGKKYKPTYVADDGSKFFPLPLPTDVTRVTSSFGFRATPAGTIDYGGRGGYVHAGIDYGAPCGTPIRATGDGVVYLAGSAGTSGIAVGIDHGIRGGKGFATRYHHMSSLAVNAGSNVKRGQLIGYSGTTGNSSGCHLHFETIVNGEKVNPVSFLR